ncbi:MAG: hypothetical protein KA368_05355 [Acidobacteria bacterium]|nr:hypothetical protein [Acidobacteriota bacterium]
MARQITTTPETPATFLRLELAAFASGDRNVDRKTLAPIPDGDESQNIPFIKALCESFQAKALAYYNAGGDEQDRLERVAEIGQAFREISFKKNNQTFTLASDNAGLTAAEAYKIGAEGCPPGTMCVDRTCVGNPEIG